MWSGRCASPAGFKLTALGAKPKGYSEWRRAPAVTGSKPLLVIAGMAAADARNLIRALAASAFFDPAATPAENTVTFWTSGGSGPT